MSFRRALVALALGLLGVPFVALPAAAKPAKPGVTITGFAPAEAPARGAKVLLSFSASGASSCSLVSEPSLKPVTNNCSKPLKLKVPANPLLHARSFKVKLTATGPGGSKTVTTTLAQHAPIYVDLFGDSMLYQAGPEMAAALEAGNPDVVAAVHAFPMTSICFWNQADRADGIPKMIAAHQPAAILLEFSGIGAHQCAPGGSQSGDWNFSFTPDGLSQTTRAYTKVLRSIRGLGVNQVTVMPLPTRDNALLAFGTAGQWGDLRAAIEKGVSQANLPNMTFLDASPSITKPDGSYSKTLPCLPEELSTPGHCWGPVVDGVSTNYVRADDGLHLCNVTWRSVGPAPAMGCPGYGYSSGAYRFGSYVASAILAKLAPG